MYFISILENLEQRDISLISLLSLSDKGVQNLYNKVHTYDS